MINKVTPLNSMCILRGNVKSKGGRACYIGGNSHINTKVREKVGFSLLLRS